MTQAKFASLLKIIVAQVFLLAALMGCLPANDPNAGKSGDPRNSNPSSTAPYVPPPAIAPSIAPSAAAPGACAANSIVITGLPNEQAIRACCVTLEYGKMETACGKACYSESAKSGIDKAMQPGGKCASGSAPAAPSSSSSGTGTGTSTWSGGAVDCRAHASRSAGVPDNVYCSACCNNANTPSYALTECKNQGFCGAAPLSNADTGSRTTNPAERPYDPSQVSSAEVNCTYYQVSATQSSLPLDITNCKNNNGKEIIGRPGSYFFDCERQGLGCVCTEYVKKTEKMTATRCMALGGTH